VGPHSYGFNYHEDPIRSSELQLGSWESFQQLFQNGGKPRKPVSRWPVAGTSGCTLSSSQQSGRRWRWNGPADLVGQGAPQTYRIPIRCELSLTMPFVCQKAVLWVPVAGCLGNFAKNYGRGGGGVTA